MNKVDFPKILEQERIILKSYAVGDIDEHTKQMFRVIDANRDFFIPWHKDTTGTIKYQNPDMCKDYITRIVNAFNNKTQAGYGVYKKDLDKYIGHIMAYDIDYQNNSLEFGLFMDKAYTKQGLMREAVLALEYFFKEQGAHHFTMKCANDNENSSKMIQSLGYQLEGTQKENRLYIGDTKYRDTLIFGKVVKDNQR